MAARCLVPPARAALARERVARGDLGGAADALAGAGPGLTPAGDDALAGILFARRALGCDADLLSIARSARTTTLSEAFLLWAARGQALACVHTLLEAAAGGDADGAGRLAATLASVGHSSGADFAWGLCLGLDARYPVVRFDRMRSGSGVLRDQSPRQTIWAPLASPARLRRHGPLVPR